MSSDGYFEDELDSAFLTAVDAIEAAHASRSTVAVPARPPAKLAAQVIEIQDSDEDYDISGINDDALHLFDQVCAAQDTSGTHVAKPMSRKSSKGTVQTNLFGQIIPEASSNKAGASFSARKPMSRTNSSARTPLAGSSRRTKQWDHTAFAKYGWKKPKGKGKASFDGEEEEVEEEAEEVIQFEQFPAPSAGIRRPPLMKLKPDLLAAKRWLYPLNKPKRDYQFNIVKKCLFENTLVAIPTGLGKTFIAGVVMLNFYTWFPEGKVVFVAPTRPLVAQQIEACHQTCGIPGSHAVELTGQNSRSVRAKAWSEKRVFFMTPQTLMNDIRNEECDCRDIVLLVVDEAHKGTGDYAYAQVVRYLMAKNPHFRLLALTATPGSTPEAVQAVVDSLHISHVEIRDEESLDLRRYMHEKRVDQHVIHMNEDIMRIADLLASIMHPLITQLQSVTIIRGHVDAKTLHPYRCQAAVAELRARRDRQSWALTPLLQLGALARAMGYLYEGSMTMCYNWIKSQFGDDKNSGKKQQSKMQQNPKFQSLMQELELQRVRGFTVHPKKEKLLDLIIQHFGSKMSDENGQEVNGSDMSRVMVFSTFRENVDELVDMLDNHKPLIRAVRFIGQGNDKQGRKGYAQKEQMEVIKKFKAGEYNVLVSTSVGEEGLDIGEVDMIICYESQKTPIRMLQRIGRTGRKKNGVVHVLLAEGREDRNWDKAKENYQHVQHFIVRAEQLELYDDASRMLPDSCKPDCIEMVMDIEEYDREEATRKASTRSPAKATKRKRNDDIMRNIPAGAATSFVSVKDLLVKGAKGTEQDREPSAREDGDDDDIMGRLTAPSRAKSLATDTKPIKGKRNRRASTFAGSNAAKKKLRRTKTGSLATSEMSTSQLNKLIEDDSDDKDIEGGLFSEDAFIPLKSANESNPKTPSSSPSRRRRTGSLSPLRSSSPEIALHSIIDLTTPGVGDASPFSLPADVPSSPAPAIPINRITSSVSQRSSLASRSPSVHEVPSFGPDHDASLAWLIADDEEPEIQFLGSSPVSRSTSSKVLMERNGNDPDDSIEFVENYIPPSPSKRRALNSRFSRSKRGNHFQLSQEDMPPPVLPARFAIQSPEMPSSTFAVRAPGHKARKRPVLELIESSPTTLDEPAVKRGRIQHHRDSSSPVPSPQPRKKKRIFKDAAEAQKHNPWVELEAEHSGDERSLGSSDAEEDMDEYDASFVQDMPESQVSPSYDQSAVYRQSLLSQAPGRAMSGPLFANKPRRRGPMLHMVSAPSSSRQRAMISSSPRRTDEELDDYVVGSFVVEDEDEDLNISYQGHSSDG